MHRMLSTLAWSGLLLILAACASPSGAPAKAPTAAAAPPAQAAAPVAAKPAPATVKVGVTPVLTVSGLFVALERGYFAEQGIELVMENISDPTPMVPSLATGQIDVGNGAMSAGLWNAIARGSDLRLVALQSSVRPAIPSSAATSRNRGQSATT